MSLLHLFFAETPFPFMRRLASLGTIRPVCPEDLETERIFSVPAPSSSISIFTKIYPDRRR
jgi:hypothetical protein